MTQQDARRMTSGEVVVETLIQNGIDTLFCLPGIQNDHFMDAVHGRMDVLRPIHTRHEQGVAYMALGAALATGKPAAYCVVPGPGFLNTSTALATAYSTNAKVLAIMGQIPLAAIGRGYGMLHEIPDQSGILDTLTKWSGLISAPAEASGLANEAFRQLLSGRPRPVGLECPMDVWGQKAQVSLPGAPVEIDPAPVDLDAVEAAAKILGAAKNPLIAVGGGAQAAGAEVRAVAEMLQAPVLALRMGHGVLDARHPLSVNSLVGHKWWETTDCVLAVGTRLQTQRQVWGMDDDLKVIHVDVDPVEINRIQTPAVGIVGDSGPVLAALAEALPKHNAKRESREDDVRAMKQAAVERMAQYSPQVEYVAALRDAIPEDGILVDELTQVSYVARISYPVYNPRTFIATGYQGTLGWGFATALGVKVACPEKAVVSISGDGGFMFNVQELATAAQHGINLVAVVFNDGAYGNVLRIQKELYGNRTIASSLRNPDFMKLAESYGVAGLRATSPDALRERIEEALKLDAPVLIEVPIGEVPNPWDVLALPKIRPNEESA
jgi:acetolactate synthase-1/2/3 large subunit